ncbi:Efflux pump roqT [Lachnellula suecica]|uniref:Efflux pump roqT n=1 Tax=Lachnellula suecica TaxID=602035 RepID=A0A8T9CD39_9HELO|nr:Efflux pump roqT [Lachnellula suecica]
MTNINSETAFTGFMVAVFGLGNVIGPVIGGVFTQHLTWRWCFWINLIGGAVTAILLVSCYHPKKSELTKLPFAQKIKHLDLPGLALFMPSIVMLLVALQWGGNRFHWKSPTVLGLIMGFIIMMLMFVAWQWRQQEEASIPPRIAKQRSLYSAAAICFFGMGAIQVLNYYIPFWFQVIKGLNPQQSGVRYLALAIPNFVGSLVCGGLASRFGYYNPYLFFGTAVLAVASGVISTWKINSGNAMINGVQVMAGLGISCVGQTPVIGLILLFPDAEMPIVQSLAVFFQFFGGAIFLAIAENLFVSSLVENLQKFAPMVDTQMVIAIGAAGLRKVVSGKDLDGALLAYNAAIAQTFYLAAIGAVVGFLCSFGMKWRSIKEVQKIKQEAKGISMITF